MKCPHCGSHQLYDDAPYICCLTCGYEVRIDPPIIPLPPEDTKQAAKHGSGGRPKKPLSEERRRWIIRLHQEGKTQEEIRALCGSCPATIGKVIKNDGMAPRKRGRPSTEMSKYRKNTIRRLQKEGKTISVIAQTVGVDQSYVRQVLRGKFD